MCVCVDISGYDKQKHHVSGPGISLVFLTSRFPHTAGFSITEGFDPVSYLSGLLGISHRKGRPSVDGAPPFSPTLVFV